MSVRQSPVGYSPTGRRRWRQWGLYGAAGACSAVAVLSARHGAAVDAFLCVGLSVLFGTI